MPMAPAGDIRLAYQVQGHGDPLLLIMGYRASSCMWGGQAIRESKRMGETAPIKRVDAL